MQGPRLCGPCFFWVDWIAVGIGYAAAGWRTLRESNGREGICRQLERAAG